MTPFLRTRAVRLLFMCIGLVPMLTCGKEDERKKHEAEEAQRQMLAQRQQAEQTARAAEQTDIAKIIALGAGGCVVALVAGLAGIAVGSRAIRRRSGKEEDHG